MDNVEEGEITPSNDAFQFRMGLNDNKAGMEGLDKEKINKIIMDATKGSKFYENELKKDKQLNQRIEKMMQQKSQLTSQQIKKAQLQVDRLALELERNRDLSRVIVHVDMDAFYAAVEMRDNPELKDTPMAVGSMSMLSTSNYHARRYGVRAAMPGFIAKKLCPSLVIVPVNFDKYRAVSKQVREILAQYDPNFLPMSLDEAYLDITDHLKERISWPEDKRSFNFETKMKDEKNPSQDPAVDGGTKELCTSPILFEDSPSLEVEQNAHVSAATSAKQPLKKFVVFGTSAEEAVNEMRFRIEQETTLTASAGIAPNMMLAKVCSDKNKPNGQYRIVSERQAVKDFIKDLPIRKVPGIGKVTEKMLKALGVMTCTDLYQQRALLSLLFSETSWQNFLHISLGIGSTHIERDGERKSMSTERTFSEISCTKEQYDLCRELCKDLAQDLLKEGLKGKTVTLKLKNVKFEVRTRALTVTSAVSTEEEIFSVAKEILKTEIDLASPEPLLLRLMGVRVSGFLNEETKKHQKSIVGFLQNEKSGNAVPLGPPDRTSPSTQTPGPQRQSFFNQKRAAREQMGRETFTDSSGFSKGAEIDSAEPRTEMPQTEVLPQKPDYFCPICSQNKSDWDLESFNKHIDRCLTGSPLANDFDVRPKAEVNINNDDWEKEINSNEIRNAAFSIQNLSNQTLDTEPINDIVYKNTIESNIVTNIRNFHTFGVDPDSVCTEKEVDVCNTEKEPAKPNSEMASSDQIFICPVCNVKQDVPDLAAFNRHVDICLNEGIIEKLREERVNINHPTHNLQHTGGTGRGLTSTNAKLRTKRSAATNQNPVSKKSKPNPSKNTIDRFFK